MTDPNLQYVAGPKGDPGQDAEPVNYTVVNRMVNQILVSNPALKGVKGDQGNSATDAQVSFAVQAYISANEEVFKGVDGVSPVLDYSQIITDIEAWMQTDAIKPIFTGDAANVDTSALQTSIINAIKVYMDENPNQFKGVDGTSPSINYTTVIEGIKTWMTSSPEVISIFKGVQGNVGLPAPAPDPIDYNIVKNDVDNYLSANVSALVSPTIISNAFVDASGNLISSLSTAISTSTSQYLAANPPAGASQSQVNSWIASYLSANPFNSLTVETLTPLLTQLGVSFADPNAFVNLAQPSNIVSFSTPDNFDSANMKWGHFIIPNEGWSFNNTTKVLQKTSSSPNDIIYDSNVTSTFKSFVMVVKYANPGSKVLINDLLSPNGDRFIAWDAGQNKFYTGGDNLNYRVNVDGTFMFQEESVPSINLADGAFHIIQVSRMTLNDWFVPLKLNGFFGFHGTTGSDFQLVAMYNSDLTDAEMTANYQALLAKLPSN